MPEPSPPSLDESLSWVANVAELAQFKYSGAIRQGAREIVELRAKVAELERRLADTGRGGGARCRCGCGRVLPPYGGRGRRREWFEESCRDRIRR